MIEYSKKELREREERNKIKREENQTLFSQMIIKNIPKAKSYKILGNTMVTAPLFLTFRKDICLVYRQWLDNKSLGIILYDKKHYEIIKKLIQNFDTINGTESCLFKQYE